MLVRGIGRERDNERGCVLLAAAVAAGDADAHIFLRCFPHTHARAHTHTYYITIA